MSEAHEAQGDEFETEFAAARDAEHEDGEDAGAEGAEAGASEGEAEGAAEGEGEGDEGQREPVQTEADKVAKRLQDTQRALKAERRKRQEDERRFSDRLAALERGQTKDAPLDPVALLEKLREDDEDPIGDIQTVKQLAKLLVGQTDAERQADAKVTERARAMNTISTTMREYEDDFRAQTPDYDKAAKHFMDARAEELKDTGLSGADLTTAMQNDFAGIVTRSIQAGKDPAEIIYNMAKRRGFAPKGAATKLATIAKGQEQSKTLSTGGGAAQGNLSADKVANLKGAAFDAAFEKLRASEKRR